MPGSRELSTPTQSQYVEMSAFVQWNCVQCGPGSVRTGGGGASCRNVNGSDGAYQARWMAPISSSGALHHHKQCMPLPEGHVYCLDFCWYQIILLVVKDKVGRPPGEFGVSRFIECDISLQCFDTVGWATGRASGLKKKLGVDLLVVMI